MHIHILYNAYSIFAISTALLLCHVLEVPSKYLPSLILLPTSSHPAAWLAEGEDPLICGSLHWGLLGSAHWLFQSIRHDPAAGKNVCVPPPSPTCKSLLYQAPNLLETFSNFLSYTFSLPCQTWFSYCPLSLRVSRDRHRIAQLVKETSYKYTRRWLAKSHNFFWRQDWH